MGRGKRDQVKEFIFEEYFENYRPVSTEEIEVGVDASRQTVSSQTGALEDNGVVECQEHGNKKFYAPSDEVSKDFLRERELADIKSGIDEARNILGGIREPKLREVAFILEKNPESEVFRKKFYEAAKDLTWTEPKESKKSKLLDLVKSALALDRDDRNSPNYPKEGNWEKKARIRDFIRDNREILSKIELEELERENLRHRVHVPYKLKIFLGEDNFYYSVA